MSGPSLTREATAKRALRSGNSLLACVFSNDLVSMGMCSTQGLLLPCFRLGTATCQPVRRAPECRYELRNRECRILRHGQAISSRLWQP